MKKILIAVLFIVINSCDQNDSKDQKKDNDFLSSQLKEMINEREKAMINKDIETAMSQFSEDISWINSQGYYFEGKKEVRRFHAYLAGNDSLDYYYKAGKPRIRIIDSKNALAYYSWKMFWYKKSNPLDTVNREIGLMTLTAQKNESKWQWIAVTNQHTPWFYDIIENVTID
ncbi:hypothetical protein [Winogradskyella sp.]|uniref:hypothetical protein n=1 Tax=Winogradskyella sp. TaxID=1883156 RepID=UPI00261B6200|nr:hypothetical protein [Winogradskyella sp.]